MNIHENNPVRSFKVGKNTIYDCGKIELESNEMLSFKTHSGREYDFTAKPWGFYASPSINGRLKHEGFKTALVQNSTGRIFLMCVEKDKVDAFLDYLREDQQEVLEWLHERDASS